MHPFSRTIPFIQYLNQHIRALQYRLPLHRPIPEEGAAGAEKVIFLHIPKTAGTSVRQVVTKEYPGRRCLFIYSHSPAFFASIKPLLPAARAVYGHVSYGIHELLGIRGRYVAFLRDPVRRVVSFYNHQARKRDSEFYRRIREGLTLDEMLRSGICHQVNNHMVRISSGHAGTQPVDDEAVFEKAVANIEAHFEMVGLVERLPESMALLGARLGFRRRHRLPRRNVNRHRRSGRMDQALLSEIRRCNRLDLMLYAYVQQRFQEQVRSLAPRERGAGGEQQGDGCC